MEIEIEIYETRVGKSPFLDWIEGLNVTGQIIWHDFNHNEYRPEIFAQIDIGIERIVLWIG